jgi:DNA-binding response OmpR family regulator
MNDLLHGKTVLVVDDDPDIRGAIEVSLRSLGATVLSAGDGGHAISMVREHAPDLLVLDMMLPKASGFLVLETLADEGRRPPTVMVTANRGRRHQAYAEALGVEGYFLKPVPLQALLDRIAAILKPPAGGGADGGTGAGRYT